MADHEHTNQETQGAPRAVSPTDSLLSLKAVLDEQLEKPEGKGHGEGHGEGKGHGGAHEPAKKWITLLQLVAALVIGAAGGSYVVTRVLMEEPEESAPHAPTSQGVGGDVVGFQGDINVATPPAAAQSESESVADSESESAADSESTSAAGSTSQAGDTTSVIDNNVTGVSDEAMSENAAATRYAADVHAETQRQHDATLLQMQREHDAAEAAMQTRQIEAQRERDAVLLEVLRTHQSDHEVVVQTLRTLREQVGRVPADQVDSVHVEHAAAQVDDHDTRVSETDTTHADESIDDQTTDETGTDHQVDIATDETTPPSDEPSASSSDERIARAELYEQ